MTSPTDERRDSGSSTPDTPQTGQAELDAANRRIAELSEELDATNRGIIALHTELDSLREAEARARTERELLADRERIADDLHNQTIQRLFGAIMSLEGVVGIVQPDRAVARLRDVIDDLDGTIGQLRNTVFALQKPKPAVSLRTRFLDAVGRAHAGLGFAPAVSFEGPIDADVPQHVAAHLLAVVEETLSNIGQHAHATGAELELSVTNGLLLLVVRDNGRGLADVAPARGFRDMQERAETLGGTFRATSPPTAGTSVEWRVPLP